MASEDNNNSKKLKKIKAFFWGGAARATAVIAFVIGSPSRSIWIQMNSHNVFSAFYFLRHYINHMVQ